MNLLISFFILFSFFYGTNFVHADQCAWIEKEKQKFIWESAEKLLTKIDSFIEFCEPCLNNEIGNIQTIRNVKTSVSELQTPDGVIKYPEYISIEINNKQRDIAYIYVRTGQNIFTNLAILFGCPVHDVSPMIYLAPRKKARTVSWAEVMNGNDYQQK